MLKLTSVATRTGSERSMTVQGYAGAEPGRNLQAAFRRRDRRTKAHATGNRMAEPAGSGSAPPMPSLCRVTTLWAGSVSERMPLDTATSPKTAHGSAALVRYSAKLEKLVPGIEIFTGES